MEVVDYEPYMWYLLQDGEDLLFDVSCSHGAVDYEFMMLLDNAERAQFRMQGREFLCALAETIQYSAPGVIGSSSKFKDRNVSRHRSAEVYQAVLKFRPQGQS